MIDQNKNFIKVWIWCYCHLIRQLGNQFVVRADEQFNKSNSS